MPMCGLIIHLWHKDTSTTSRLMEFGLEAKAKLLIFHFLVNLSKIRATMKLRDHSIHIEREWSKYPQINGTHLVDAKLEN